MVDLAAFNTMVRKWADQQPAKYRLSALAFGYPCDTESHCFDGTLNWIAKHSRRRKGEGVSHSTLNRHLKVFEASGVIEVERRRNKSRNMSSVYHVNFDKVVQAEDMGRRQRHRNRADTQRGEVPSDAERLAWLASLEVEPPEHSGYDMNECAACKFTPKDCDDPVAVHVDGGGLDPWQEPMP